ncbi:hypothetical protein [Histidinibacterium aquaticum]|uniref:WD40 repeat domain-containing protein n=1 Tax=Histidinibacterium aquaticum TaxID=2613962 RepID=A0A5J5GSQ1_9RHOB|nr:hypothetical protein [Histidinibacterium aquaticum]KAA9010402.1 hypothetical protein F3S47_03930 [Histidinibacterium aquaticum]
MRALIALLLTAAPASAMEIWHRESWPGYRGVSLAFDPWSCGLWVATEGPELILLSPAGEELRRLETPLRGVRAVAADAEGLLVTDGLGSFFRLGRRGEDFGDWSRQESQRDVEGLHVHPEGGLLVVGDDAALVQRLDAEGREVFRIEGYGLDPPMPEPQGIGLEPNTGNILAVDDNEGLNALFEFDPEGTLLSVTPLSEWGYDAEAVAVHAQTGQIYIGYDGGVSIAVFDYLPTRTGADRPVEPGPDCAIS